METWNHGDIDKETWEHGEIETSNEKQKIEA
jgi:hypothetical protein